MQVQGHCPLGKEKFLLGLDNAEELMINRDEKQSFRQLLSTLQQSCSNLTIVISSSEGKLPKGRFHQETIALPTLNREQAAELFLLMTTAKIDT